MIEMACSMDFTKTILVLSLVGILSIFFAVWYGANLWYSIIYILFMYIGLFLQYLLTS